MSFGVQNRCVIKKLISRNRIIHQCCSNTNPETPEGMQILQTKCDKGTGAKMMRYVPQEIWMEEGVGMSALRHFSSLKM